MRNIVLISILIFPLFSNGQSWDYNSTNSRYPIIGAFTYSGGNDYQGYGVLPHFQIRNTSGSAIVNQFWAKDDSGNLRFFNMSYNAGNKTLGFSGQQSDVSIFFNHNVGIGISTPDEKLHVFGQNPNIFLQQNPGLPGNSNLSISAAGNNNTASVKIGGAYMFTNTNEGKNLYFGDVLNDKVNSTMKIEISTGNVGIGTSNTFGYKLAVNGTIGSTEVKVENTSAWPDFVFESSYNLRTLEEVEKHIAEKGHLPEIPNEAEVTENGINLGEMNAKLLQKIEELTLYLIEQNKQNQAQQEQLEAQSEIIEQLKKEVSALKNE